MVTTKNVRKKVSPMMFIAIPAMIFFLYVLLSNKSTVDSPSSSSSTSTYIRISTSSSSSSSTQMIEGTWDITEQVAAYSSENLRKYLIEEKDFDYSHQSVLDVAKKIKAESSTVFEAIKDTAKYTYDTVKYNSKVSATQCYDETASSVLHAKVGDCVSMARLDTAILRAMGIPARTVGGCLSRSVSCAPLFAAYPGISAKVTDMSEGDFKKRGFLHEWVEAWVPEKGWVLVEATSGQVFPITCQAYIKYAYDTNQYDRCVITDKSFWNICAVS